MLFSIRRRHWEEHIGFDREGERESIPLRSPTESKWIIEFQRYVVANCSVLFVFGVAAQKPFGWFKTEEKQQTGRLIHARLRGLGA